MNYELLTRYLDNDSVVIEAGCFDGTDTINLANIFNKGHIYGFEPVSGIFKVLKNRVQNINNVSVFNYALDGECGEKDIYISSGMSNQSSSLLKPKDHLEVFPDCKFLTIEKTKTITIDEFVKQQNISKIDFMWIDLQGAEMQVLLQAKSILPTVKAIYSEYSLTEFYEGLTLYDDFKVFMKNNSFEEVYNQDCFNYLKCGNSLFVRT